MEPCDLNISIVDLTESFIMVDHRGLSNSVIVLDDSAVETSQKKKKKQRATSAKLPPKPKLSDESHVPKTSKSLLNDKENKRPPRPEYRRAKTIGDCTICWDELGRRPIASTKCGHIFCLKCLKNALKINRTCPICRKYLKSDKSYHQIYLGGDY